MCQCDTSIVQRLENDFKNALQQQSSLEQWAAWLQMVVDTTLQEYQGKAEYAKAARQFLLKWSFYSSMVMRDLTLRSASSFGSFHLIRLLYDEYIFYLVEHKIAKSQDKTTIAVLCDRLVRNEKTSLFCHLCIFHFISFKFQKNKDLSFDLEYQLELITGDRLSSETPLKRLKHE